MKAHEKAKEAGFKSLVEVSRISGESTQNLNNWLNKKPLRFEIILKGSLVKKREINE